MKIELLRRLSPLALMLVGGCMFGPYDGQIVTNPSAAISMWGGYPSANTQVDVEARWFDGNFYPFASTTTTTGYYTAFATNWYWWTLSAAVPGWGWTAGVTGSRAEVRGRSGSSYLESFPEDGFSCMLDASAAGTSMTDAQFACGAMPRAFLFTPDYRGLPTFSPQSPVDYPQAVQVDHSEEIQGAASTASDWYFAHNADPTLLRVPLTSDLEDHDVWDDALAVGMPSAMDALGYDHFGDPDEHAGNIYVPVEGGAVGAIAQFDLALGFRGFATLAGASAPWVAIDPTTGMLYTSEFCDVHEVEVYTMQFAADGTLTGLSLYDRRKLWDANSVPLALQAIQGGAFSDSGNLYLVSDADYGHCSAGTAGVYGFEGETLRKEAWFEVAYDPSDSEELEGIDVRDVTSAGIPGITGQIHVVMLDNDTWNGDDLYFKHYVAPVGELGFL